MTQKRSMTVARRLGTGFAVVTALLIAVASLGSWGVLRAGQSLDNMFNNSVKPLQYLGDIQYLVTRNRILLVDALLQAKPEVTERRLKEFEVNVAKIDRRWQDYLATSLGDDEKLLAEAAFKARGALVGEGLAPMALALKAGRSDEARRVMDDKVNRLNPAFREAMDKLLEFQVLLAEKDYSTVQAVARQAQIAMVALALVAAVASVGAGVIITRAIVRALGAEPDELAAVAERIAGGSLVDDGAREAPAGSVMASMQGMRDSLVRVVGSVRSGVDSVATASAQIAQGNADLSSRTEEQASSLQQTAASMEQLTGTVRTSADNARQANQLARGASETATRGGSVVEQVVQTMAEIQASSNKIAEIIGVIDGIAFQTNILALNAAVEAARAGEQGRGFAVVASEVRSLAQRSAEAARQIKGLIGDSVAKVTAGGELVHSAGQTMNEVVTNVKRVSDLIGEITAAAGEQSQGIAQVGQAVQQLDQTTQQNAALVEESAAAAESLKAQAARLAEAVSVFRLEGARA